MTRVVSKPVLLALLATAGSAVLGCSSKGGSPASESRGESHDAGSGHAGSSADQAGGAGGTVGSATRDAGSGGVAPTSVDAGAVASDAGAVTATSDAGATDAALPPLVCAGTGPRFATGVVAHAFGPGQSIGQEHFPEWVLGPPAGAGACMGATTNVISLGNGGSIELEFAGNAIVDGPGTDFIVFENAFGVNCDLKNLFAELATVAVSEDGVTWTEFPCTATQAPYGACAGTHVVYANAKTNTIDPTDPATAGGDPYDLADIGIARARFVRITDRVDLDGTSGVFDLDAVSIVHPFCP
jgi:hypothetical protein